jgi:hypothetical protein
MENSKMIGKSFDDDFDILLNKLQTSENFAFSRYSDGEMFIMQNRKLILGSDKIQIDEKISGGSYSPQDHKNFDPKVHGFFKDQLLESYKFQKENYFKGLSCRCCVGNENFEWMRDEYGVDDGHLTWANLWVNGNYVRFIKEFVPQLDGKNVVLVVNEQAKISTTFNVVKDFRVGQNCIINDYGLVEIMKSWIQDNEIRDHVFLFSASSLSCFLAHQLFKEYDNNTYIDIGTTLNHMLSMDINRGYLKQYHHDNKENFKGKKCVW